jgi:transposase-like protein
MRGPKPHYPITLTDDTAAHLRQLMRAHSTPQAQVLRARIVLTSYEQPDWSNDRIAQTLGTSERMVRKWRRRWVETPSLADAPRSGAPRRFPPCAAGASQRHGL